MDESREKRAYYERLYARIRGRIQVEEGWRILDVAGGNGQLMRYLGIRNADILDCSKSGLEAARKAGFMGIYGDIERRFPMPEESYDAAFLFEVLEHLHRPSKTLAEVHNVLKPGGVLYVGQPNMRADGVHHVRRYYLPALLDDLDKAGFKPEWTDFVPAYTMRDSILSDIRKNPSWVRKAIQSANLALSLLPYPARYAMARAVPNRFALLFIIKAVKMGRPA
ncbi:MAG: hypothetical protein A3D28_05010 [Omnitrophica bacterium RIFCSPHIGHO2_02_FULL_63_14]|nr:MAG: hypothetical protein A3D28_05010 [Omnitrophica bacterium RIFCSPHIGHO2_02_FULL_63_14]